MNREEYFKQYNIYMSSISLNKPFKHFDTIDLFTAAKVSANAANTSYIQNGTVHEGTPDILWEHTAFIHDIAQIWNRGRFYNSQKYLTKLAAMSKNTFYDYRKSIITIIDKSFASLYANNMSVYENYPGIMPSIVVAPSVAESNIDIVFALMDSGCDVLSTAYDNVSVYDPTKTEAENYEEIQNDMTQVEQWLIERSIFTNCYKYPDTNKAQDEAKFIAKYEEYGVVEGAVGVNGFKQDNMMLNGYAASSATAAVDYLDAHIADNTWIIIVVDSSSITGNISSLVSAINDYVAAGDAIYLQMNEALKVHASEFNVGRASDLPFKVYKNGEVDATLTTASQAKFDFDNTSDEYKDDMMSYTANHIREYTQLLLEDGRYINTEKYETIDYVGLGYFVISEDTLEFTYTNNEKFKTPMLTYVHENTSYNSFGDVFLNELATYMYDRLADEFMRYNATYLHTYMATYMNTYFMQLDPPA